MFEPLAQSELYYSIFAVLDATADTQWIRISPIRPTVNGQADLGNAEVTLERLGTGSLVILRDTLTSFESPLGDEAEVVRQNFWTDEKIEPGAEYRLTITRVDGRSTTATVAVASAYDEVVVGIRNHVPSNGFVRVREADYLGMVHVRHHFVSECDDPEPFHAFPIGGVPKYEERQVPIVTTVEEPFLPCAIDRQRLVNPEIFIVASGSEWPSAVEFGTSALGFLDLPSNIEHGIGFLGGVFTRTVPWETCTFGQFTSSNRYCELTYNSRSATLSGTVYDAFCDEPLEEAIVQLTEIIDGPVSDRRIRTFITKALGGYWIGALEPDRSYERRVSHPDEWFDAGEIWVAQVDTVEFLPAEERIADVRLMRRTGPTGAVLGPACGFR